MIDRAFYFALNSSKNGILVLLYIFFILLLLTFARALVKSEHTDYQ